MRKLLFASVLLFPVAAFAQAPASDPTAQIAQQLNNMQVTVETIFSNMRQQILSDQSTIILLNDKLKAAEKPVEVKPLTDAKKPDETKPSPDAKKPLK
jgi:hypothetical protein